MRLRANILLQESGSDRSNQTEAMFVAIGSYTVKVRFHQLSVCDLGSLQRAVDAKQL
jgi:hypothetical protein